MNGELSHASGGSGPGEAKELALTFIVSLRHPANSTDYTRVVRLLRRTIRSLTRQDHRQFAIIVVANQRFPLRGAAARLVKTIIVDFPPPSLRRGPVTGRSAVLLDKGTKLAVGLSAAQSRYVMFVDADDFVAIDLTRFVSQHQGSRGWYVERGLILDARSLRYKNVSGFNEKCGTSLIVRRDLLPMVPLPIDVTQQDVVNAYGLQVIQDRLGSHRHLAALLSLEPLPSVGAVYCVGTGENHSGSRGSLGGRTLGLKIARNFGIDRRFVLLSSLRNMIRVGRAGLATIRSIGL